MDVLVGTLIGPLFEDLCTSNSINLTSIPYFKTITNKTIDSLEIRIIKVRLYWPLLEHDERVSFQVRHVDELALGDDVGMFAAHEPSDVREEEAPLRVVRVAVRVAVAMVLAMVSNPDVQAVLRKHHIVNTHNQGLAPAFSLT